MQILIVAVGKPRDPALAAAIHEYEVRAARYWSLRVVEVRAESVRGRSSDTVRERESRRLLDSVAGARVVACEVDGKAMRSEAFAEWLRKERDLSSPDIAFLIGGASGLGPAARKAAHAKLSLSPWTLPHEMARLVLAEQLYRAGTIIRGEPYHK